ncbi:FKBP-type peptidyl-prolyl cis-trans isomerase [Zhongshania sp.]|jgi:FKBP-type peptidyl-prolyl cis-trans isomerase SlpA|uniref:FKBP-type peptidyl-prolyl cis-trans isomerase n=1 Tax=Zhongshania sp. TaxID=1971902 RepID=UPI0039E3870F
MTNVSVAPATEISLHFSLSIIDGDLVDSTFGGKPANFVFGDGSLLPSVEAKLLGLTAGAKETFILEPQDGFGQRNPLNIQRFPRSQFSADMVLEEGLVISFADAARAEVPGVVSEVSDEDVMVDFNHPLAGRKLSFRVEILSVSAQADGK